MARKFLYAFAALIVVVFAVRVGVAFWGNDLARVAFVPTHDFEPQPPLTVNAYDAPALWYARAGAPGDAGALPQGVARPSTPLPAAVFFVPPTTYIDRAHWNAQISGNGRTTDVMTSAMLRGIASAFNTSAMLWVPRTRQATVGAFLTDAPAGHAALELAYHDVEQAFAAFLRAVPPGTPIVLAGHSQGAFHLKRLIADHVAGTPIADRLAAVYVIGWPVSPAHDLPRMGLPACTRAGQPGCIVSWLSFAEPADPAEMLSAWTRQRTLDGTPGATPFLCTNPLTGTPGGTAPASTNLGTLKPDETGQGATLVVRAVPARCDARGLLLIGPPPEIGHAMLPGNNTHIYDVPLFWANLRADMATRVSVWQAAHL
jgi:hypothetical protein